jgi:PAS domain S-box-containing protein
MSAEGKRQTAPGGEAEPGFFRRYWPDISLVAFLVAGLLATAGIARDMIGATEADGARVALNEARSFAHFLASDWARITRRISRLQTMARRIGPEADTRASLWDGALEDLRDASDYQDTGIQVVARTNARGDLLWSTEPLPAGLPPIEDQPVFRTLQHSNLMEDIGPPEARTSQSGRRLAFARALRGPDGTFEGATLVYVDTSVMESHADALGVVDRHGIVLVKSDGSVLTRCDGLPLNEPFDPAVTRTSEDGPLPIDTTMTGRSRIYAANPVPGQNMVVVVGLDEASRMAPYREVRGRIIDIAAVAGVALTAFVFIAIVGLRHNRDKLAERRSREVAETRGAMLRDVAERAGDVISLQDGAFRNVFANSASLDVLGVPPERLLGERYGVFVTQEDKPVVEHALGLMRSGSRRERFVFRANSRGGAVRWLEAEMVALNDGPPLTPDTVCFVTISRDITARKLDEDRLRAAEAEMTALIHLGPGQFYRAELANGGRFELSFLSGNNFLGYALDEVRLTGFMREHLHPADWEAKIRAVWRTLACGHGTVEYRFPNASGQSHWVRDDMRSVNRENGPPTIVGYLTDITEQRENQSRYRHIERLATLGEVSTGIAHEMNQPLAAIAMASENALRSLRHRTKPPELSKLQEKLMRINDQVHRLSKIVELTGLFSRSEDSVGGLANMEDVLANVRLLVHGRLETSGARLSVSLQPDLPPVLGSPVLLEQVLMNLIINSCDAYGERPAPDEQGRDDRIITVTAGTRDGKIRLTVADRAGGIPPQLMGRIFDPFFTTKPPGKGTGLGLSISFATIADMGGTLLVSNKNEGAEFEILVPAVLVRTREGVRS